jgi:O-antigen/teichoic acid export membrane protein
MLVSLYTSRVVLNVLGVEDYGIYNAVGGVVAMFGFIHSSMSGATSRFLTFELGRENQQKLKETFSSALIIHAGIALLVFVVAETIGLWFLMNKLVIPVERMKAAHWIYQFSIFSMIVGITRVPYNAMIIAYEKMNIYAYIEILNVILKLLIVYLLVIGPFDKLILYAGLILIVSVLITFIYRAYCKHFFEECRFHWVWKPEIIRPMLKFSSWDLYGNMSVVARTQGVNMLLNIFFGPLMNAAAGVATQVQGAVMGFAGNIITAFRPQIIKSYALQDYTRTTNLVNNAVMFTFLLLLFLSLPLMSEIHFVLTVWLKQVPEFAPVFCFYTLLFNFFATISHILATAIHATGNIKRLSIINGTLYVLVIPFSYCAFKLGYTAWLPYLFNVCAVITGLLSNAWTVYLYMPDFSFKDFFYRIFLKCLFVLLISFACVEGVKFVIIDESWTRFLLSGIVSTCIVAVSGWLVLMNKEMRKQVLNFIKRKAWKKDW